MKKYINSILSVFMLLLMIVFPSCENIDKEVDYTDYGTSIFIGDGDAGQAGLSTVNYPGYATFNAQLDNNSMTFTYLMSWNRLSSSAKAAYLFMPADSGVFLPNYYYAYTSITTDTIGSLTDKRTMTSQNANNYYYWDTMLSDFELSNLLAGKWYYAITSNNNTTLSTTQSGEVRGQIKLAYTIFKNKPTVYFMPIAVVDNFSVGHNAILNGNLSTNDTKTNGKRPTQKVITVNNQWFKISDPSSGAVIVNIDGSFTYTPNSSFTGMDYFYYQIVDEYGNKSRITKVTITVV